MIFLLIVLVLVLVLITIGYIFFYFALVRLPYNPLERRWNLDTSFDEDIRAGADWFRAQNPRRIVIPSRDGLRLCGYFLPAEGGTVKGTVMMVHGYRSSPWHDFGLVYRFYHAAGWNILTVWQRSHGESEGKYISMGIKERFDVCDWAKYLSDCFGPDHKVVLSGISMGSSTVLMALGADLPENVRGVIADCGFTGPYDEFSSLLKSKHLPAGLLLALLDFHCKALAGFSIRDYSTVTALQQNYRPVLFFHGEIDPYVPIRFMVENYAACAGEKTLVTVPNAGHGGSYLLAKERCEAAILEFLARFE